MGRKKPPGENKYGRCRARKRLELYYQREAETNQRWEEAVPKWIQKLADYEKLCEATSIMLQDYLRCIKYIKSSNDARKEFEIVTLSDDSDEDEDQAQCNMENNTVSKHDAKVKKC